MLVVIIAAGYQWEILRPQCTCMIVVIKKRGDMNVAFKREYRALASSLIYSMTFAAFQGDRVN